MITRTKRITKPWWHELDVKQPKTLRGLWALAGQPGDYYYRGMIDSDYRLTTKLARNEKHVENEWNMMSEFSVAIRSRGQFAPANSLELLALAQHHGLPTRLLDLTSSFGIALYFAIYQTSSLRCNSIIWRINTQKLIRAICKWFKFKHGLRTPVTTDYIKFPAPPILKDGKLIPVKNNSDIDMEIEFYMQESKETRHPPLIIGTPHISPRLSVQDACFLMLDPAGGDLYSQLRELRCANTLSGILLTPGLRQYARDHLAKLGLRHRMLFPDIDNLAKDMTDAYANET